MKTLTKEEKQHLSILHNIRSMPGDILEKAWLEVYDMCQRRRVSAAGLIAVVNEPEPPRTMLELFKRACMNLNLDVPVSQDYPPRFTPQESWIAHVFALVSEEDYRNEFTRKNIAPARR